MCRCMHLAITGCSLMGGRWLPSGYNHLSEPKLWDYMLHKDQYVGTLLTPYYHHSVA